MFDLSTVNECIFRPKFSSEVFAISAYFVFGYFMRVPVTKDMFSRCAKETHSVPLGLIGVRSLFVILVKQHVFITRLESSTK